MTHVTDVDFVVNCYERTYSKVLQPGFVSGIAASQRFDFSSITILINNVVDRLEVQRLADHLLAVDQRVSRVVWVDQQIDAALATTGLRAQDIARAPHFSNCCLVAVALSGPEWLCYWDSDAVLDQERDWITPTIAYMTNHPRVLVGGLEGIFREDPLPGLAEREAINVDSGFALGFGFTDIVFLARRADLARPIYRRIAPASWRYPLSHIQPVFEQRIDAHMRRTGRLRATLLGPGWTHAEVTGMNYPASGFRLKSAQLLRKVALRITAVVNHPALRPWPKQVARPVRARS